MTQKKQQTANHHWVAQAYLRAFSIDPTQRKEKRKIWRFSKDSGDPERKPIANVTFKRHLYSLIDAEGNRDDEFERIQLAKLDNLLGSEDWARITSEFVDLCDDSVRKFIGLQMAVMYLRNPAELEAHKSVHKQMVEFLSQDQYLPKSVVAKGKTYKLDESTWTTFRDANDNDIRRNWLTRVGSAAEIAQMFMSMRWSVIVADNPTFITTDNPVTFVHPSLEFRGIKNSGTLILFPLSPTRILVLDHKLNEPDGQYYPLWDGGAAAINGLLWRSANEYMLSSIHPDIVCAQIVKFADEPSKSSCLFPGLKKMVRNCFSAFAKLKIYFDKGKS